MCNLESLFKSFSFYLFKSFSFYQMISNCYQNLNFIFILSLVLIFHLSTKCMSSTHHNQMGLYSFPNFLFFGPFLKVCHKYAPGGMLLKFGLLARRHRWWRRDYTSQRHRFWRLAFGFGADVAMTWHVTQRRRSWCRAWRSRSQRRARRQDL